VTGWAIFEKDFDASRQSSLDDCRESVSALDDGYFFGLRAFRTSAQFELDVLAFIQRFVAVVGVQYVFEMYENIGALFLFNKAEAFVSIKPFNNASSQSRHNKSYKKFRYKALNR
jgi:hypothetical protein